MPCRKGTWYWRISLHDLQLLSGLKKPRSQVLGEKSRNRLSHLLWFFVHIKRNCKSSSLWALHAFRLLQGWFFDLSRLFCFGFSSHCCFTLFHLWITEKGYMLNHVNSFVISGIHLQSLHLSNLQQIYGRYVGMNVFCSNISLIPKKSCYKLCFL